MVTMKRPKWLRYEDPFSYGRPTRFKHDRVVGLVLAAVGAALFILEIVWLIRGWR
jgi:hypothetical protein